MENEDLGPFVEGLVMGLMDWQRLNNLPSAWRYEMENDASGTHALYFLSPTGLRWRVKAVLEPKDE